MENENYTSICWGSPPEGQTLYLMTLNALTIGGPWNRQRTTRVMSLIKVNLI